VLHRGGESFAERPVLRNDYLPYITLFSGRVTLVDTFAVGFWDLAGPATSGEHAERSKRFAELNVARATPATVSDKNAMCIYGVEYPPSCDTAHESNAKITSEGRHNAYVATDIFMVCLDLSLDDPLLQIVAHAVCVFCVCVCVCVCVCCLHVPAMQCH
jgi:hypothetical protein